ncbi:MAG TPA: hypothetical protein PKC18_16725 [Lacipirellulaceae bacterium]|nr:hypothetical protein [Lacipirellulaceae bacterium]
MVGVPGGLPGGTVRIPTGQQGGGLGCGTLIVIGGALWFLGINPLALLGQLGEGLGPSLGPRTCGRNCSGATASPTRRRR